MRTCFVTGLGIASTVLLASGALALERTSVSSRGLNQRDGWSASTTTTLLYYNHCTGWIYGWSNWATGESIGTWFDAPSCNPTGQLSLTWHATFDGIQPGYGYTGTIEVRGGDQCTDPLLASRPWLPPQAAGWFAVDWSGLQVTDPFLVRIIWTSGDPNFPSPVQYASDHPAAGPTGPPATGTCYPAGRQSHSLWFGIPGGQTDYCPGGTTLSDGVGDIEWLMDAVLKCTPSTAVEDASWGQIKGLFR